MRGILSLLCALSPPLGANGSNPNPNPRIRSNTSISQVCRTIRQAISNASAVYYPFEAAYTQDIQHYMSSSTQDSVCTVEPGTANDVSKIIKILGDNTVPFGVKGGGHATNQGFSSTPGVLIAMTRFNKVVYHPGKNTVDVPTGITWDDVYAALDPYNVNVVGARASGIGAAGVMLGGGYSYLTNLHGLTVDTLVALELVLPNGTVVEVREVRHPDLFFALKGGFNNFGIVTRFTLRAFRQTEIWAGTIVYDGRQWDKLADAIVNFQAANTDPNANILPTFGIATGNEQLASIQVFYNKPTPPAGLFDRFLNISSISKTVSMRNFSDFIQSNSGRASLRGAFGTVSLANVSSSIVRTIVSEAKKWTGYNLQQSGAFVAYSIEPFVITIPQYATPSAFPHNKYASPLNIVFGWTSSTADSHQLEGIKQTAKNIAAAAKAEGQDIDSLPLYPNYCLADTPLEKMYGDNVAELKRLKNKYDPTNVMGRAGGFKF